MSTFVESIDATSRRGASLPSDERLRLLGPNIVARYPGPLVVADISGDVTPLNEQGIELADALNGTLNPQFISLLAHASQAGAAQSEAMRLDEDGGAISIFVIPIGDRRESDPSESFFVLGRDATMDRNLREALIESRRRYKDLVECSSDFVWETAPDGTFDFVTTRGALGFPPERLVGLSARSLVDRRRPAPNPFPFEATYPVEDAEVWFRDADDESACMLVSCVPLYSACGDWRGARGVCKDVTVERQRDEELSRARAREQLLASIVKTIRDEVEPDKVLQAAARALLEALNAAACWIYRAGANGELYLASNYGGAPVQPGIKHLDLVDQDIVPIPCEPNVADVSLEAVPTYYHDRRNGVLCVARASRRASDEAGHDLLAGVADQLGIALQQIDAQDTLLALSRTDGLTGLLNRRAFVDEVELRMVRAGQTAWPGSLFYVDLDNFKLVNDVRGHQKGDEALRYLASRLTAEIAPEDFVGRIGGDEFAIWADETDASDAATKARSLVGIGQDLARFSEGLERHLSTSIGVAVYTPGSGESLKGLFARADAAMYEAKRGGKGRYNVSLAVETS